MKKQTFFLVVVMILTMLLLAACGGQATQAPVSNQETGSTQPISVESETNSSEAPATEAPNNQSEPATGEETNGSEETTSSEEAPAQQGGVPADVPIATGAYELFIEGNGTRIRYKVDLTNKEVAEFYQAELSNLGWNKVIGADSVIGNMGSISRDNDKGDRLVFGLSYNPTGKFTTVTIDIIRAP